MSLFNVISRQGEIPKFPSVCIILLNRFTTHAHQQIKNEKIAEDNGMDDNGGCIGWVQTRQCTSAIGVQQKPLDKGPSGSSFYFIRGRAVPAVDKPPNTRQNSSPVMLIHPNPLIQNCWRSVYSVWLPPHALFHVVFRVFCYTHLGFISCRWGVRIHLNGENSFRRFFSLALLSFKG